MIKFSISFPEGWSIIKDEETFRLLGNIEANDALLLEKWQSAKAKPLVAGYRYNDKDFKSGKTITINPNITAMIEYLPSHVGINNAYQYIPKYKAALSKHQNIEYKFEANQAVNINGFQFDLVAFEFEQFGKVVKKRSYLHKYGDYMLNITLVWDVEDNHSFEHLIKSVLTIQMEKSA